MKGIISLKNITKRCTHFAFSFNKIFNRISLPFLKRRWIRPTGNWRPARDDRDFAFPLTFPPLPRPDILLVLDSGVDIYGLKSEVASRKASQQLWTFGESAWFLFICQSALRRWIRVSNLASVISLVVTEKGTVQWEVVMMKAWNRELPKSLLMEHWNYFFSIIYVKTSLFELFLRYQFS